MTTVPKGTDQWNRKLQGMIRHLTPQQLSAIKANRAENLRRMQEAALSDELVKKQAQLLEVARLAFAIKCAERAIAE